MDQILRDNNGPVFNNRPQKLLLTYLEAGDALSISPGMVSKLVRTGRLKVTKIGRCARIEYAQILRLSNGQLSEVTNG